MMKRCAMLLLVAVFVATQAELTVPNEMRLAEKHGKAFVNGVYSTETPFSCTNTKHWGNMCDNDTCEGFNVPDQFKIDKGKSAADAGCCKLEEKAGDKGCGPMDEGYDGCECVSPFCWCIASNGVGSNTCGDSGTEVCEADTWYEAEACPGAGYRCKTDKAVSSVTVKDSPAVEAKKKAGKAAQGKNEEKLKDIIDNGMMSAATLAVAESTGALDLIKAEADKVALEEAEAAGIDVPGIAEIMKRDVDDLASMLIDQLGLNNGQAAVFETTFTSAVDLLQEVTNLGEKFTTTRIKFFQIEREVERLQVEVEALMKSLQKQKDLLGVKTTAGAAADKALTDAEREEAAANESKANEEAANTGAENSNEASATDLEESSIILNTERDATDTANQLNEEATAAQLFAAEENEAALLIKEEQLAALAAAEDKAKTAEEKNAAKYAALQTSIAEHMALLKQAKTAKETQLAVLAELTVQIEESYAKMEAMNEVARRAMVSLRAMNMIDVFMDPVVDGGDGCDNESSDGVDVPAGMCWTSNKVVDFAALKEAVTVNDVGEYKSSRRDDGKAFWGNIGKAFENSQRDSKATYRKIMQENTAGADCWNPKTPRDDCALDEYYFVKAIPAKSSRHFRVSLECVSPLTELTTVNAGSGGPNTNTANVDQAASKSSDKEALEANIKDILGNQGGDFVIDYANAAAGSFETMTKGTCYDPKLLLSMKKLSEYSSEYKEDKPDEIDIAGVTSSVDAKITGRRLRFQKRSSKVVRTRTVTAAAGTAGTSCIFKENNGNTVENSKETVACCSDCNALAGKCQGSGKGVEPKCSKVNMEKFCKKQCKVVEDEAGETAERICTNAKMLVAEISKAKTRHAKMASFMEQVSLILKKTNDVKAKVQAGIDGVEKDIAELKINQAKLNAKMETASEELKAVEDACDIKDDEIAAAKTAIEESRASTKSTKAEIAQLQLETAQLNADTIQNIAETTENNELSEQERKEQERKDTDTQAKIEATAVTQAGTEAATLSATNAAAAAEAATKREQLAIELTALYVQEIVENTAHVKLLEEAIKELEETVTRAENDLYDASNNLLDMQEEFGPAIQVFNFCNEMKCYDTCRTSEGNATMLATCKENRALQVLKDAFPGGTAQEDTENKDPSGESVSLIIPDINFRAGEFGCDNMADCKGEGGDYKCFANAITSKETIQSIATQMVKIGASSDGSFPVQMQILGHYWRSDSAGETVSADVGVKIKCRADVVTALIMKEAGDIFASMPQTGAVEFDAEKFMCSAAFPTYDIEAKTTAKVGAGACNQ